MSSMDLLARCNAAGIQWPLGLPTGLLAWDVSCNDGMLSKRVVMYIVTYAYEFAAVAGRMPTPRCAKAFKTAIELTRYYRR